MSSAGLFLPFDAFIDHVRQWGRTEWFLIPGDGSLPRDFNHAVIAMVGKFVLRFLPDLFAEDTWPMNVSREACLVVLDRSRYTDAVLAELQADNTESPLRDASIAYLLSLVGQPNAKPFAGRALETMGPTAFDKDLKILLRGRCGQWLTGVQAGIASLDDQEAESLTNLVRSESVKSILRLLHTHAISAGNQESIWYLATHQPLGEKLRDIILR